MNWKKALVAGLLATSMAGCNSNPPRPPKPTKPTINPIELPGGLMCFNHEDSIRLGNYIMQLEQWGQ